MKPYTDNVLNISDGVILQMMILITSWFEFFDSFDSSLVVGIAFVLVFIPLVEFLTIKIFISKQTIKESINNIIKQVSFLRKTLQVKANDVIANNAAVADQIIDNFRRSRSSIICEMYVSNYIVMWFLRVK